MASLFTFPKQQALDNSGNPLPGAKLFFYETGTSSPKNTYQDADFNTPHANPVVADAFGVFPPIWLDTSAGDYRVRLTDSANVEKWTVDDVAGDLSQESIGAALWPRTAAEISASVTPVNYYYEPGDVRRYGATGDGATDDTTALQNALLCNHAVKIPNGTHRITASLEIDDDTEIVFESRQAIIKGNLAAPLLRGRNGTTQRRYHVVIWSGKLDNTARTNAGGIGIDLLSTTMCKVFGTFITNVETGVRIGGTSAQGSFYNEFHGVDITVVDQGYEFGTLGNDNKIYGGRVNDCEIGARLNNNSGNLFDGLAVEAFTTYGLDVSPTATTQYTRIINPRLENTPTVGTGIRVNATAQSTMIIEPQCVGLTTNISDSGTDTIVLCTDKASPRIRSRRVILSQNNFDSSAWAQLYAQSSAYINARNGNDSAYADIDMKDAIVRGQVHVQGTNAKLYAGSGTPQAVVTANVGSVYLRTDGGAATSFYVKESGSGNTGWVAK